LGAHLTAMKLIVFGASGDTGRDVVRQALQRGHAVTAAVRDGARWQPPEGARVAAGEALDAAFVDRTIAGHDAVLSALGLRYRRGRNPFSALASPPTLLSQTAAHFVAAMRKHGVGRIAVVSAAGVGDSRPSLAWPLALVIRISNVRFGYEDLERAEALLAGSGLDWLAVRPTTLTHAPGDGRVRRVARYGATMRIARADVARFMLDELERPRFAECTPMISRG
jgi:putative NADH-flavin reductase